MDAEKLVREFCDAFSRQDLEELVGYFTDDAVYHNIPMPAAEGKDAIRTTLGGFLDPSGEARFEVLALGVSADGNTILTERVDYLTIAGKQISIPVMGTFEVRDGKISAWRDYFDMGMLQSQLGG